jgi:CheY-like chemotaxis protein
VLDDVILLVEDNPDDQELTRHAIKASHISNEVVVARDGVEALDYLLGRGAYAGRDIRRQPAITLLDLNMPRMDGLAVLQKMRSEEATRLVPVIILTSSKEDQDLLRCYGLGANSYIRKPVGFEQFNEAIRLMGEYWLRINERPPNYRGLS